MSDPRAYYMVFEGSVSLSNERYSAPSGIQRAFAFSLDLDFQSLIRACCCLNNGSIAFGKEKGSDPNGIKIGPTSGITDS
jgi:hypothetical protein